MRNLIRSSNSAAHQNLLTEVTLVRHKIWRLKNLKIKEYVMTRLNHSAQQTNTNSCGNSVDPDETAHNELSHQDLHCLPFCLLF